jgi:dihydrolipoamide dehydrogenase
MVRVDFADGGQKELSAPDIVIATGSRAALPPIAGIDGQGVITSTEALDLTSLPTSIAVIGGGVIGMELGSAYADFGSRVTVLEAMPGLLPGMDGEVVAEFTKHAEKKMAIQTSAMVKEIADTDDGQKRVVYEKDGQLCETCAEKVLVAVGRVPETDGLGLDKAGVQSERGRVTVDENFSTNVRGIFCIGDANANCMLAHAASAQASVVAERIAGGKSRIAKDIIPSGVYTDPEIAAVGLTEEQAVERGLEYRAVTFPFRANGRALVLGKPDGFVKIIGGKKYNDILGVHILGPHATELIAECALAMKLEACVETIADTIHAHPTVSESIMEAADKWLKKGE